MLHRDDRLSAIENYTIKYLKKSNQFGNFCVPLPFNLNRISGVNIYNKSSLIEFFTRHSDCKRTLEKWHNDVQSKKWRKPGDVTKDFNTARTIKNNRVIFKINENDYRLIEEINYQKGWLFIKFVGTHPEYDKIDPETADMYRRKKQK